MEKSPFFYGVDFTGPSSIDSLEIHFFDPGPSLKPETPTLKPTAPIHPSSLIPHPSERSACSCPQPPFQGRLDWCPDGSCPTDPTPEFVPDPTHVIIHHTAGTNVASDWAAVVRSIWDFHVNTNGWDDIGYNWLVDPNGVLYEGRGDGRLGAHFCAQNGKTTGICVMGDFTSIQPQAAALNTLADFLAWETCDENIDPLDTSFHSGSGLVLPNISGHRDGCQTSCPGDMFYPLLPSVRQATQDNIVNGCEADVVAAPTVLAITFVSHDKVSLKWLDNSSTETGFILERSDNVDNNFSPIVQLPANSTTFSDNGVSPNNTYFYRVRAKQGSAFSDYSNVAVAITSVSSAASQLHGGSLTISPNPTSGQVFLSLENQWIGKTEVAVFDGLGRLLVPPFYEVKNDEKQAIQLDLSDLPAGLYWVKMVQGTEAGWIKIIRN
ncbi:MAG: N-acetylmuramoyl-L-alanine amidase [Saprospiraceae bacterium]|nr:N-acetylmuramoyl-L-alanine amidase [Saprospiraceae bacterium]